MYTYDLELRETTKQIVDAVERAKASRVVLDSLSEIRLMAQSSLRYRRHLLSIKHYFARHGATVILLDDLTAEVGDKTAHSVAHGVIQLEELAPAYGAERRRMRVLKYRGQKYRGGYHDFTITTGGINVFPRLVAAEHHTRFTRTQHSTEIGNFDVLLGGGVDSRRGAIEPDIGDEIAALRDVIEPREIGALLHKAALDERAQKVGLGTKITGHGKSSAKGSRRCNNDARSLELMKP